MTLEILGFCAAWGMLSGCQDNQTKDFPGVCTDKNGGLRQTAAGELSKQQNKHQILSILGRVHCDLISRKRDC